MDSFLSFWSENDWKVPKMSYFMQFWTILGQYNPLKCPWYCQRSPLNGSYSPKILHKIVLPENGFISIFFWSENYRKVPKISYFMPFWPIFGPYDPLKSPLHYQQRTLQDSYSPKVFHEIVLPENGFISVFFCVKMFVKCPKCHISCNFGQFRDYMTQSKAPFTTNEVR